MCSRRTSRHTGGTDWHVQSMRASSSSWAIAVVVSIANCAQFKREKGARCHGDRIVVLPDGSDVVVVPGACAHCCALTETRVSTSGITVVVSVSCRVSWSLPRVQIHVLLLVVVRASQCLHPAKGSPHTLATQAPHYLGQTLQQTRSGSPTLCCTYGAKLHANWRNPETVRPTLARSPSDPMYLHAQRREHFEHQA